MGYLKIPNLYRDQSILMFRECYAMEKIHGTSAHIAWVEKALRFFSGGVEHLSFCGLFDKERLAEALAPYPDLTIYGEAYGGKCQGMSETYGKSLRFTVFDVKIGDTWLSVHDAEEIALSVGLHFVPYERGPAEIAWLDSQRDLPSRVGTGVAEGIVARPLVEMQSNHGRVIVKHKRPEFSERTSRRDTNPDPLRGEVLAEASAIAIEWVTPMRLSHVLDKLGPVTIVDTPRVIAAMQADIEAEGGGEFLPSRAARKAIANKTVELFHRGF